MLGGMKIGLFGHGKMGKMVKRLALELNHSVVEPSDADVCIDFSHASVVLEHIKWAVEREKPLVIGTTGWESDMKAARSLIDKSKTAVLFSPNFSLGVAHFIHLLKYARARLADYEVAGVEYHHSQKQDSPSGTAKRIAEALDMSTPFASVRCGSIAGKHEVLFDSPFDTITLIHEARNREDFARGALKAAAWIRDKKGWYTLDDLYSADYPL